jgi:hypothetical protein
MRRRSDSRYAELYSHPAFVRRLLESFVQEDFVRNLDFSGMEPYRTKFVTEDFARRESDVIWKVRFMEKDLFLFLLIEFQSTVDRRMPLRLLRYIAEFYESYRERTRGERYPAVFPVVLYNGSKPWTAETEVAGLIEPSLPGDYIPHLRYYLVEERAFAPQTLLGLRNLAALLFLAETLSPEELVLRFDAFFDILKHEEPEAVAAFSRWINDYLAQLSGETRLGRPANFGAEEGQAMLEENLRAWKKRLLDQGRAEGREEGREKGREEATRGFALRLLASGLDYVDVAALSGLDVEEVRQLPKA